jgi:glycosyltransferase involved in cell wall biosynthesis
MKTDGRTHVIELSNADLRPYRIPFLQRMAMSDSIHLEVWHGQAPRDFGAPAEPVRDVPVPDRRIQNVFWPRGRHRVLWQRPALKALFSDAEVLVCPEVVHNLSVWLIALAHRLLGKRLILKGYFYRPSERLGKLGGALRRLLHRRAAAYLPYTSRGGRALLDEGIAEDRVFVSGNTLDTEALTNLAREVDPRFEATARAELGIEPGPVLLFLGKLIEVKRVDIAIAIIGKLDIQASLLVIGEGRLRRDLEELASGLPVRFLGPIYDETVLAGYLSLADLVLLPGRVGLTCIHGFASGVPCVTSNESLVEQSPEYEYVQDGYNGLVIPSIDPLEHAKAIATLLGDPERLEGLAKGALETAARLDMSGMVHQYEQAVRRALLD